MLEDVDQMDLESLNKQLAKNIPVASLLQPADVARRQEGPDADSSARPVARSPEPPSTTPLSFTEIDAVKLQLAEAKYHAAHLRLSCSKLCSASEIKSIMLHQKGVTDDTFELDTAEYRAGLQIRPLRRLLREATAELDALMQRAASTVESREQQTAAVIEQATWKYGEEFMEVFDEETGEFSKVERTDKKWTRRSITRAFVYPPFGDWEDAQFIEFCNDGVRARCDMLVDDRPTPVSIGCVYGHILQADETSRLSPCQQLYAFPTQLCLEGVVSANVRAPIGAQCETPPCICYVGCNAWIDTRGTWLSKIMHESRDEHCNVRFAGGILLSDQQHSSW